VNEKRWWIGIIAGGVLAAGGLGTLLYYQHGTIVESREKVRPCAAASSRPRKLIEGTSALEREVIVLRELTEVMKGILPDTNDVNNLVRTLQRFSDESGVRIAGLKKKAESTSKRDKTDFEKVAYTLSLEGDAFQYLDFLDLIESHSRFMRVPNFRLTAANRTDLEKEGVPSHKVSIDVETFVYEPQKDQKAVTIDGYDRKRDLLLGEIDRRKSSLQFSTYAYRGARGRRDPWIDPRVPVRADSPSMLSVRSKWTWSSRWRNARRPCWPRGKRSRSPRTSSSRLMTRADMDGAARPPRRGSAPRRRRPGDRVRALADAPAGRDRRAARQPPPAAGRLRPGPRPERDAAQGARARTMVAHREAGEYKLMLGRVLDDRQPSGVDRERPAAQAAHRAPARPAYEARTVLDFEKIKLEVGGVILIEGGARS
jgi:Tfp pilus assembly protein PilO